MAFNPDEFKAGQVLSAEALNAFFAELERVGRIAISPPIQFANDASGLRFSVAVGEPWWILLTGGGTDGKYDWERKQGVTGGGWDDHPGGQTGTTSDDPAIESTGKEDVTIDADAVHRAWRDPVSRALFFTAGDCP